MRLHHCPSYVMERWKGRWRKRVSRKSLIFFLKLAQRKGKYFHHPNVNLSNPKIAFFFVQAMICSVRGNIVKDFSFWVVKPSFSRLWWVQAGHKSQIPSLTNQLLFIQLTSADSSWIELAIPTQGTQFELLGLAFSSAFLCKPLCNTTHWDCHWCLPSLSWN